MRQTYRNDKHPCSSVRMLKDQQSSWTAHTRNIITHFDFKGDRILGFIFVLLSWNVFACVRRCSRSSRIRVSRGKLVQSEFCCSLSCRKWFFQSARRDTVISLSDTFILSFSFFISWSVSLTYAAACTEMMTLLVLSWHRKFDVTVLISLVITKIKKKKWRTSSTNSKKWQ